MKDLVIRKPFGSENVFYITQEKGDTDHFCMEYVDKKLGVKFTIKMGGDTDGGTIPSIAKFLFDPLLDKTAHGYIWHDEFWRHRVYYKELFKDLGLTFRQTNRIMQDIHKLAGCSWSEIHLTRLSVRYFGWFKWKFPKKEVRNVKNPTLFIEKINVEGIESG